MDVDLRPGLVLLAIEVAGVSLTGVLTWLLWRETGRAFVCWWAAAWAALAASLVARLTWEMLGRGSEWLLLPQLAGDYAFAVLVARGFAAFRRGALPWQRPSWIVTVLATWSLGLVLWAPSVDALLRAHAMALAFLLVLAFDEARRAEARRLLDLPEGAPLFLFSGLLRLYKGWDVLLEAFSAVRRELPSALLILAGEPWGEAKALQEPSAPAGVLLRLRFLPPDERGLLFDACDAVVCPYRHATGSGIAADALAHGRPVIGSDVPGLSVVVRDGISGLLVPPGDPGLLAGAMLRFVREGLGPRLSSGAEEVGALFSPEGHARTILALGGIGPGPAGC